MSHRCEAKTLRGNPCKCRIDDRYIDSHGTVWDHLGFRVATLCKNHMSALIRGNKVKICRGRKMTLQIVSGKLTQTPEN